MEVLIEQKYVFFHNIRMRNNKETFCALLEKRKNMRIGYLKVKNWLLVGVMTFMGLLACKKEPSEPSNPDYGQIVPCYGVVTCEMRSSPLVDDNDEDNDAKLTVLKNKEIDEN